MQTGPSEVSYPVLAPEVIDLGKLGQDCFADGVWRPQGHEYGEEYYDTWDDGDCLPQDFYRDRCIHCGRIRPPDRRLYLKEFGHLPF